MILNTFSIRRSANKTRLGCDGKAGRTMQTIAVNCRPLKVASRAVCRDGEAYASAFNPNRRKALKRMALLGAAGLVPAILPVRSARAADLTAGFVYIGPRMDWGWNQSFAVAAAALRGVPNVRVVQADYLPESTDYGSGKDDPETRAYTKAMEDLIADGAGLIFSTSFDDDPFLLAMAKQISECRVPPSHGARKRRQPAERRQPKRIDQSGPLCERRCRGPVHDHEQARLCGRHAVRHRAAQREFIPSGQPPDQSRCDRAGHLHRRVGG